MSRTRLLWFSFGFASTYAAFSQFVLKDLLVQTKAVSSHFEHDFRVLETRISQIEASSPEPSSVPVPVPAHASASDLVEG